MSRANRAACGRGAHEWNAKTLRCDRNGCDARQDEPGQSFMFGESPLVAAEALRRERSTGQGEMFKGQTNPRGKARRRNRVRDEDQEALDELTGGAGGNLSAVSLAEGSGLRGAQRDILQVISQVFRGQEFTAEQLARELAGTKHATGRRWTEATARIEAAKTLASLGARALPLVHGRGGDGLTGRGLVSRASIWTLTEHGANQALSDRLKASEDFAENAIDSAIAHFEDEALAEQASAQHGRVARGKRAALRRLGVIRSLVKKLRARAARAERKPRTRTVVEPHKAKREPCRLCKVNHSLKAHRSHRIDGPRHRVTLAGVRVTNPDEALRKLERAWKASPSDREALNRYVDAAWRAGLSVRVTAPHGGYGFLTFKHPDQRGEFLGVDDTLTDFAIDVARAARSAELVTTPARMRNPMAKRKAKASSRKPKRPAKKPAAERKPKASARKPKRQAAKKPKAKPKPKRATTRTTVTTTRTTVKTRNPGTLSDAAEKWGRGLGLKIPARGTPAWQGLYTAWQRSASRTNPRDAVETRDLIAAARGSVSALERLLARSIRRKDVKLSLAVDSIAFLLARRKRGAEFERLREIGTRSWESRNKTTRRTNPGCFPCLAAAVNPKRKKKAKAKARAGNPLIGVLTGVANPGGKRAKVLGRRVRFGDLTPAQQRDPKVRAAALLAARFRKVPLADVIGEVVSAPDGTPDDVPVVGRLNAISYEIEGESPRAKTRDGRRIVYGHAAGDHGAGKKKTRAQLLCAHPITKAPILTSRRGTRAGWSSARGLLG